ncbi:hypothetical protein Tco_1385401 [Tanacetum coccineum]
MRKLGFSNSLENHLDAEFGCCPFPPIRYDFLSTTSRRSSFEFKICSYANTASCSVTQDHQTEGNSFEVINLVRWPFSVPGVTYGPSVRLTSSELTAAIEEYSILMDLHPRLPPTGFFLYMSYELAPISIQKVIAKVLWLEVEISNKWIENNLKNHDPELNRAGLILQWFKNTARNMVTEVQKMRKMERTGQEFDVRKMDLEALVPIHCATDGELRKREVLKLFKNYTGGKRAEVSTSSVDVNTASRAVSIAGVSIADVQAKDKGKAIMEEHETPNKVKKRVQVQINRDEELSRKLFEEKQARFNAEQEAKALTEQEQERLNLEGEACFRIYTKTFSKAEVRKNMIMYLKNQGGYKMNYFKGMTYEEIRPIFEKVWDQTQSFVPMDSEKEKESAKKAGGGRKKSLGRKRGRKTNDEKRAKKQKLDDDAEKAELKECLNIVEEGKLKIMYKLVKDIISGSKPEVTAPSSIYNINRIEVYWIPYGVSFTGNWLLEAIYMLVEEGSILLKRLALKEYASIGDCD